jgi:hypothetical protein
MSEPVAFTIRVPVKNQPTNFGLGDPPTDTYGVAWDGISVIVVWDQADDEPPMNAGQVAANVLSDVLESFGYELYVQGCSTILRKPASSSTAGPTASATTGRFTPSRPGWSSPPT